MPLPADPRRLAVERVLRALVFLLLGLCLVLAWRLDNRAATESADSTELSQQLERWTTRTAPARVQVRLTGLPSLVQRDWLDAVGGAGTALSWRGESLPSLAVALRPLADPLGTTELLVSAPAEASVTVGDSTSRVDTLPLSGGLARLRTGARRSPFAVTAAAAVATVALPDSLLLRRLLVLGRAGWETRFVVAALEERGWQVDVHYVVAPFADVRQGVVTAADLKAPPAPPAATTSEPPPGPGSLMFMLRARPGMMLSGGPSAPPPTARPRSVTPIDTATYAAVLAIDSSAGREGARLLRYVRSGGGVVLWPGAATSAALAPLRVGSLGAALRAERILPPDSARTGLELRPLVALSDQAVVLERRQAHVAVAARLEGPGRIVQLGYVDLWRWRMGGGATAPEEYRDWVNRLVAGVAYAPAAPRLNPATDPAPLANLVDRLGSADTGAPVGTDEHWRKLLPWIFGLLCIASLLEWTSRRVRGEG